MATMSHTPAQRKAWHAGKQKSNETRQAWFRRVIVKAKNFQGAQTVPWHKRRFTYAAKG